jgi:hypothetical protein
MSALPPRPSLAHLRKQAKELLSRLRATNPNATLSEAQHVLAGEYGFASWPKLKAQVEAAAAAPPLFPRLTPKARECLFFARYEASHAGSPSIEPEHLLLGLMKASEGLRNGLFAHVPQPLGSARHEVAAPSPAPIPTSVPIPLGERTKRVFQGGAAEADRLRHPEIGLVHLLLGVLREPHSIATGFLEKHGLRAPAIRDAIATLREEHTPPPAG